MAEFLNFASAYSEAISAFKDAESFHRKFTHNRFLRSTAGAAYCGFLLDTLLTASESQKVLRERIEEIRSRARQALQRLNGEFERFVDVGLNHLMLGRTCLLESRFVSSDNEAGNDAAFEKVQARILKEAEQHLTKCISALRQSGLQENIPQGFIHRASLWRAACDVCRRSQHIQRDEMIAHNFELAEADLSEGESIANRCSMLIWQIEAALERTRLYVTLHECGWEGVALAQPATRGDTESGSAGVFPSGRWLLLAREKLDEAKRLVKQTEKPYRPYVPEWKEWKPPEYVGVFKKGDIVGYHCRNGEIERLQKVIESLSTKDM